MEVTPEIEYTEDGSTTLRHPVYREMYHSIRGAVGESKHVYIEQGLKNIQKSRVRILEMGFGSGLNAWLTLDHARQNGILVEYHTVELYPISMKAVSELNYTDDPLFGELHNAPWDSTTQITPYFSITKIEADLTDAEFSTTFDLVYYDAFAPQTQPELWKPEIFASIIDRMADGGVLVTYSSKGTVKRALREVGFEIERLPGALGKRHMVKAVKTEEADRFASISFSKRQY